MKLNESQIQDLHVFVKKHYVEWYDVQTELVDHLANGIEMQWIEKPNLEFNKALKNEFKKFGIFGFSGIVEEKTNMLDKYYRKLVWKCLKDYFKLPKMIFTAFFIWIVFFLLQNIENKFIITGSVTILLVGGYVFYLIKATKKIKTIKKQTGKKWLFDNTILQLGGLIHILNLGIYIPTIFSPDTEWTAVTHLLFACCVVIYSLIFFVSTYIVPPRIREQLSKQHPEYCFI